MPAKSQKQQRFMAMVLSVKKGLNKGKASSKVRKAAESMSESDARDFASTKHKNLPEKVDKKDKD